MTRRVDLLVPGYFKMRLVKGGPEVAVHLRHGPAIDPVTGETLDRSFMWSVWVNGREDPKQDPWRVHEYGRRIGKRMHDHMVAVAHWAENQAPGLPEANPRRRVDLNKMASLF